jgi:NAD(P)-dependent dehydrogenase (short-subunit alcohol dehydrogenase family)
VDLFDLDGKVALVTGGTRGVGAMVTQGLLQAGASVYVSSRKPDPEAVRDLSEHGRVVSIAADLSTEEECVRLATEVAEREQRVHILVNNAGAVWGAPLEEFPAAGWEKVLSTNVEGIFHLTVALLGELRASAAADDPARVINIGSIDGLRVPSVDNYSYSASKAAVHMLTRHLARRLAGEQITVNAIAPGPFESKMMAWVLENPDTRAVVEREVPLGRIGRPDDVAGLAQFLASRAGAYLTGTVIPLDGGITGCSSPGAVTDEASAPG